jgi:two-component system OmpR family sensor kinase
MTVPNSNRDLLFVPWLVLASVCAGVMWMTPGEETIPYHLAWIGIALAYGLEAWPWARTLAAVIVYTVITGGILVVRAATGVIGWGETAEIPLMSLLVLLVVWNVRRRHVAYAELSTMARLDHERAAQRMRFARMTSHEMRTPATIAIGYAEVLLAHETDATKRSDLEVIRDELGRLVLAGDRIIRTIRMHDQDDLRPHDVAELLGGTVDRWRVLADRDWVVDCAPIEHVCSEERMRACIDTLVENAVRYTEAGDTVRVFARLEGAHVVLGVADSGPGMSPELLRSLSRGDVRTRAEADATYVAEDPKAQTGLGLALVREAVQVRGGRLVAGVSSEGGALVAMAVPHQRPRHRVTSHLEPRVERSVPQPA